MNRLTVTSRVGDDGVLHVTVPLGPAEANREVQVTIEPVVATPAGATEYMKWLDRIAGGWQGEFVREHEGDFETREPFP